MHTRNRMDFDPTNVHLSDATADMVNNPPHYNQSGIECIEAIYHALGDEGFKCYCQGNAMKYLWRYKYKGKPAEDLKKAKWYINQILEALQDEH
jgi:hypothetical protein